MGVLTSRVGSLSVAKHVLQQHQDVNHLLPSGMSPWTTWASLVVFIPCLPLTLWFQRPRQFFAGTALTVFNLYQYK